MKIPGFIILNFSSALSAWGTEVYNSNAKSTSEDEGGREDGSEGVGDEEGESEFECKHKSME